MTLLYVNPKIPGQINKKRRLDFTVNLFDSMIKKSERTGDKTYLPLVHTEYILGCPGQWVCAFDFDGDKEGFDPIADKLSTCKDLPFTWARSPSGNLKFFFKVQCAVPKSNMAAQQLRTEIWERMEASVGDLFNIVEWNYLSECLDGKNNTLTRVFATHSIRLALLDSLALTPIYTLEGEKRGGKAEGSTIVSVDTPVTYAPFKVANHHIPAALSPFIGVGAQAPLRRRFVQLLLSLSWDENNQFDLPLAKLATTLDCSVATVHALVKELKLRGMLLCVSHSYLKGKQAKKFQLQAELLEAFKEIKEKRPSQVTRPLPTTIVDGQFWSMCLWTLWRFSSEEAFVDWLRTLTGITEKRLREGSKYAHHHFSNRSAA